MTEIKPVGPFKTVPETTSDGQRVIGVRGQPVAIDGNVRYHATFGKWNEPLHVAIPSTSVPVSVVISTP